MSGTLYIVGVGPGDPELLTVKAINAIKKADLIACPVRNGKPGVAYMIASEMVPEIRDKELILCDLPMMEGDLSECHKKGISDIASYTSEGKDVAFLTLGDFAFYSSSAYLIDEAKKAGMTVNIIPGITSFSAASAKLLLPISTGREKVAILAGEYKNTDGTIVILKVGKKLKDFKEQIKNDGRSAYLIENLGMEGEKICLGTQEMPDEAGYFSMLVVK